MNTKHPALIIVTGRPAAGKSTFAKWLAQELKLPLISKDEIREVLFEQLGWKDRPWAQALGRASVDMMFHFARVELTAGRAIILDNAFNPDLSNPRFRALKAECGAESIQIVCNSDSKTLFERFMSRAETGNRHPGHGDEDAFEQLQAYLSTESPAVLDIGGEVIEVDTTDFEAIDLPAILDQVQAFLKESH